MALTATTIGKVLEEIEPVLRDGWIQKIFQPTARAIVLEIRVPGRTYRLLISCEPNATRLHMASRLPTNPSSPPNFCQFLRAHVQGAHIDKILQVPRDRIVEWRMTTKDGPRTLVCGLTGTSANLFVLDAARVVLRSLRQERGLIGQVYNPPAPRESLATEQDRAQIFKSTGAGDCPLSAAIEAHYHGQETSHSADAAKDARTRALKKTMKKESRRIEAWRSDLAKAERYRDYARYGELLKANFGSIRKGADRITVIDYFDANMPEMTIPLDNSKSAQGNMDDYFRKHRKFLIAERELRPRIEQAERDLDALRRELHTIEAGTWTPPTFPLAHTAMRRATGGARKPHQQRPGPFRRFTSTDGLPIFVGRNARENDELTFGLAKSDDLWLHARDTPGSHVVVRIEKGKEPPPETVKDAATLALLYSDLKKSGKGEVIYTRRKWVKKAKGQAVGAVLVTQEQSLHVTLDHTRLAALKQRNEDRPIEDQPRSES
jgi:predicted ribosome quality control (RQC) complex YloA/Tae2 family protein